MAWTSTDQLLTPLSGSLPLDGLLSTGRVTYNFELPFKNYINFTFDPTKAVVDAGVNVTALNTTQQQPVRNMLDYLHGLTGINFNETDDPGQLVDLVFGYSDSTGKDDLSKADMPAADVYSVRTTANADGTLASVDVSDAILLSANYVTMQVLNAGTVGYEELLRQTLHALGLKYTSESGGAGFPQELDTHKYTIMSRNTDNDQFFLVQPLDKQALAWLYGGDGLQGTYGLTLDASGVVVERQVPSAGGPALFGVS